MRLCFIFLSFPSHFIKVPEHGSKAKLSEEEEGNDVLEINANLSDIDDPKPRLSSAVVVPAGSNELAVNSSVTTTHKERSVALFPHSPKKVSDWAVRKPSHHGRHTSNIPRTLANTNTHLESTKNRNNNNNYSYNKSKGKTSTTSVKRAHIHVSSVTSAQTARTNIPHQRSASRNSLFDSNRSVPIITPRRQLVNRLANIPVKVDASTQTDPCKCQIRMRAKNRNRREAAKLNRDIVHSLKASQRS